MSLISRAIPGLFGGVSQQIPAMRHPTQCAVQENGLSTVVDGLFKRPGSKHIAQLPNVWAAGASEASIGNVYCHIIDRGVGSKWEAILNESGLNMVNLETGAAEPVIYKDAAGAVTAVPSYLTAVNPRTAYRAITVADTTFLVNTEKTVTAANNDAASFANTRGYVYVRQAVGLHTYTINVNGSAATYTTAASTTVDTIVTNLVSAINALAGGRSAAAVTAIKGVIQVDFTAAITLTATDSFGNTTMVVLTNGVQTFSSLPPSFVSGVRLSIIGDDAAADTNPYYVEWTGKQWQETRAYGINTDINASTLPHKLYKLGSDWVVQPITWAQRLSGDDKSNPMPSFVGSTMRDIFFYRNRLGFLSGANMVLSRAGSYYNFFSSTATQVLDTDPIDLGGNAESVDTLDWAVPFNKQLIIWASTKQQFALASGEVLSPNTAKLEPVTAFETSKSARPRQLGNRIVFPSSVNGFTQLSIYRVSQDTVSNTSEPLTDHVPTYISQDPRSIEVSETAKVLAVVPGGLLNELHVFKYEDDGEKLTQRAWQKFTFTGKVVKAGWSGQVLYLTMLYRDSSSTLGHRLCLESIDFSTIPVDPSLTFAMRLDRRVFISGAIASGTFGEVLVTATLPNSSDLTVYRYTPTTPPVQVEIVSKTVNAGTPTTITFRVKSPDTSGTFVIGSPFTFRYTFTEVFMRDTEGVPVMNAKVKLLSMLVRAVTSGFFKATVTNAAGGSYEYPFTGQMLSPTPSLVTGNFAIPVQAQAEGSVITLESSSHLPCAFPYAEWRGSVNLKAQR